MNVVWLCVDGIVLHPGAGRTFALSRPDDLARVHVSLTEKIPLAIGHEDASGESVIAGYALPEVLNQYEDGSLLILAKGMGKVRVPERPTASSGVMVLAADPILENYEIHPAQGLNYLGVQRHLMRWIGEHIVDPQTREQFVAALATPREVLGAATTFLLKDPDLQQLVVEADDVNEKLDFLTRILGSVRASGV